MVPRATFTIVDFTTNRRLVLDSDGNLISTNIDPENIESEFESKNNLDLEMNDFKFKGECRRLEVKKSSLLI